MALPAARGAASRQRPYRPQVHDRQRAGARARQALDMSEGRATGGRGNQDQSCSGIVIMASHNFEWHGRPLIARTERGEGDCG